jgi:hypothetical protein
MTNFLKPCPKPTRPEKRDFKRSAVTESVPDESNEQMTVVDWLRVHRIRFTATANGIYTHPVSMSRMKRLGVAVGLPDILIFDRPPMCIDGKLFIGAAIEMKRRKGGVLSPEQREWISALSELGWACVVAKGCDEALSFLSSLGYGERKG